MFLNSVGSDIGEPLVNESSEQNTHCGTRLGVYHYIWRMESNMLNFQGSSKFINRCREVEICEACTWLPVRMISYTEKDDDSCRWVANKHLTSCYDCNRNQWIVRNHWMDENETQLLVTPNCFVKAVETVTARWLEKIQKMLHVDFHI